MPVVPRVSCCRRKDDATLAQAVNDNDLLLCGSAHRVPRHVGCRRWQSMPVLESNSLEQWAQRYPNACGVLRLTAVAWLAGSIMQVIDKVRLCRGTPFIYCVNGGYTHMALTPATLSTTVGKNRTYGYLTNHRKGWLICTLDRVSWSMSNSKSA
jgi:hypothetical protein